MSISEIELTSKKVFNPTHFLYNETCVGLFYINSVGLFYINSSLT